MLFELDCHKRELFNIERVRLQEFDWEERDLQELLYKNLDKVIREEEMIVLAQSRHWQEEPDLMAMDEAGDIWIFELKAWKSEEANILQALKYGQIYGQYDYDDLNDIYSRSHKEELLETHNRIFPDSKISKEAINKKQHFVIITNGLDVRTRQAILYWKKKGLDVRPWIYRFYKTKDKKIYFEFNTFRVEDDPFEDIEEGYFIVNTNISHNEEDDKDMIENKKAAAFFDPWKKSIARIQNGDRVFLYRSGSGIVARGVARDKYKMKDYHDNPKNKNEEYYIELKNFELTSLPIRASEVVEITGIDYRFMKTCFAIDKESGNEIWREFSRRLQPRK